MKTLIPFVICAFVYVPYCQGAVEPIGFLLRNREVVGNAVLLTETKALSTDNIEREDGLYSTDIQIKFPSIPNHMYSTFDILMFVTVQFTSSSISSYAMNTKLAVLTLNQSMENFFTLDRSIELLSDKDVVYNEPVYLQRLVNCEQNFVYHDIKGYAVTFPDDSTKFFVERIDQFSPYQFMGTPIYQLGGIVGIVQGVEGSNLVCTKISTFIRKNIIYTVDPEHPLLIEKKNLEKTSSFSFKSLRKSLFKN